MNRNHLSHAIRERLKSLPPPFDSHYGVVPLPPPEEGIAVGPVLARLKAADATLVRIETLAAELKDPYLISRILPRREAVSSSSIEGTNSTLDELLLVEESEDTPHGQAAAQVRDYRNRESVSVSGTKKQNETNRKKSRAKSKRK